MTHKRSSYLEEISTWLLQASRQPVAEDEMDLCKLAGPEVSIVAADLEGIVEAAEAIALRLNQLIKSNASGEALEDHLIEVDMLLNHALWHRDSLLATLRGRQLWLGDEEL